jgi:hypothetical protein
MALPRCTGTSTDGKKKTADFALLAMIMDPPPPKQQQSPPLLDACHALADSVSQHAAALGTDWEAYPIIVRTGPKDAGKTFLLSSLVQNTTKRQLLPTGFSSAEATDHVTWIGPQPPENLDSSFENYIPCMDEDLEPVGFRYTLVDVPGLNEAKERRRAAALRALDSALLKVLVVEQRQLEDHAIGDYLSQSDGATIIPVINFIRNGNHDADFQVFHDSLRKNLPHATIRPLVLIPDFDTIRNGKEAAANARQTIIRAVADAGETQGNRILPEAELAQKIARFRREIAGIFAERLPATRDAIEKLLAAEKELPAEMIGHLLGSDAVIAAGIRLKLRATLLERTPYFLFPWRLALSIANLVHGATDRIPLVLAGSLPSLLTTAFAAVKNIRDAKAFAREMENGIRERIEISVKQEVVPQIRDLQFALRAEIGKSGPDLNVESMSVSVTGISALQSASSDLFQQSIERTAPGRIAAWMLGITGCAIFWGIFGWPVFQLYYEYALATRSTAKLSLTSGFPEPSISMLLTCLVLALLPMGLVLLISLSVLVGNNRCRKCVEEIRRGHERIVSDLTEAGLLAIRVDNQQIRACLQLLQLGTRG